MLGALSGSRVLVTGHTGFKGAWLCTWLEMLGAKVSGFSLDPPTNPSVYVQANVGRLLQHDLRGDIRASGSLQSAVEQVQPEIIFHLAAQPIVRRSYAEPLETFEANVIGTIHLMEAVRRLDRPCIVLIATSDKCYRNEGQVWGFRECDPLGGGDPYSASKAAAEIAVASWRYSYFDPAKIAQHGVQIATARAGNVIGGGDWAEDRIVPDCIRSLSIGRTIEIRNPYAVRPWQHVLEPLSGYLEVATRMYLGGGPELSSGWNFGPLPEATVNVGNLVDRIVALWGSGGWSNTGSGAHLPEAATLRLSIDKASAALNWAPRWNLDETVRRTIDWYRASIQPGADMASFCRADIKAYMAQGGQQ